LKTQNLYECININLKIKAIKSELNI